jgi:hypothetical protein
VFVITKEPCVFTIYHNITTFKYRKNKNRISRSSSNQAFSRKLRKLTTERLLFSFYASCYVLIQFMYGNTTIIKHWAQPKYLYYVITTWLTVLSWSQQFLCAIIKWCCVTIRKL